jgi:hypothetical protein
MERTMQTQTTNLWQFITRTAMGRTWIVILILGVLSSLLFTCSAQAREVRNTPEGRVVRNANCLLVGNGSVARGKCSVGKNDETGNTIVLMSGLKMLIKRSEEQGAASAYIVEDDNTLTPIATVVAVDSCWVGHKFKFCAD